MVFRPQKIVALKAIVAFKSLVFRTKLCDPPVQNLPHRNIAMHGPIRRGIGVYKSMLPPCDKGKVFLFYFRGGVGGVHGFCCGNYTHAFAMRYFVSLQDS